MPRGRSTDSPSSRPCTRASSTTWLRGIAQWQRLTSAYQEAFSDVEGVSVFVEPTGARSNYWLNAILLDLPDESQRDGLLERTNGDGIMTRPAWTRMRRLPMFADAPRMPPPVADALAARIVNIPRSPALAAQADAWRDAARAVRPRGARSSTPSTASTRRARPTSRSR
ncbi:MAG: DegT/DnrJ/EryC1/StrS family aminotransferase, partial [bacterium]|nr:DegT/DnrJ/EryC1/StrS family aminotransferase [bacterium]